MFFVAEIGDYRAVLLGLTIIIYALRLAWIKIFTEAEKEPLEEPPLKDDEFINFKID